jgi:hypothetical protein
MLHAENRLLYGKAVISSATFYRDGVRWLVTQGVGCVRKGIELLASDLLGRARRRS